MGGTCSRQGTSTWTENSWYLAIFLPTAHRSYNCISLAHRLYRHPFFVHKSCILFFRDVYIYIYIYICLYILKQPTEMLTDLTGNYRYPFWNKKRYVSTKLANTSVPKHIVKLSSIFELFHVDIGMTHVTKLTKWTRQNEYATQVKLEKITRLNLGIIIPLCLSNLYRLQGPSTQH